ncbi:MAG: UDP-N-acetylmuramoyl-L-alanine--D-glutamate ligase [Gammaproteobacteria bacterium]|nr:UDP-N-acetylmuramoyl-L-alanine--D-glutamate ligase [Gammaproteobacteria bacterium]
MAATMAAMQNKNRYVIVVGLGKTGLSCVRFLDQQGFRVSVVDNRLSPPGLDVLQRDFPHIEVKLGEFDEDYLRDADELIVSPGLSVNDPPFIDLLDDVQLGGDIEWFVRQAKAPIVAITGSNGKSTVTTMIGKMIEACEHTVAVGGNIGTPALDLLLNKNVPDYYVLELSSFQLETTESLRAETAVVLNVSEDHMDRYDSLMAYACAKRKAYVNARHRIVNRDDVVVRSMFEEGDSIGFTLDAPRDEDFGIRHKDDVAYIAQGNILLMPVSEFPLLGEHQLANALAALAIGYSLGLPVQPMCEALKHFNGLAHRCEHVATINGVTWINDSKGTNVGATLAAIKGLPGPMVLIAGGQSKGAELSDLSKIETGKLRGSILIGEDASLLAGYLSQVAMVQFACDMHDAVAKAEQLTQVGDQVLLSPACASFDMYKNFEHRGDCFVEAVKELQLNGN